MVERWPQAVCNGITTAYHVTGQGAHLTCIHGVGGALDSWDGVVAHLGSEFQCLRYDLRGHGQSSKPPGPYTLHDYVDDLAALLDQQGVAATHLVGFSLGGIIAQGFALQYPDRVSKLVLVSAIAGRTAEERRAILARSDRLDAGGVSANIEAAIERWFTPAFRAAHPEVIQARIEHIQANDPVGYPAAYRVLSHCRFRASHPTGIAASIVVRSPEGDG
jgi:pimeloyl-ACP methyl ester carboxylesterase